VIAVVAGSGAAVAYPWVDADREGGTPMAREPDLGVLFVHGIGDQQQFSTLAQFGGALQSWLGRWTVGGRPTADEQIAPPPRVEVVAVDQDPDPDQRPAHAEVALKPRDGAGQPERRWLLAEAWWAPEVRPPRFRDFARWILPMFPWLAAEYAVAASRRTLYLDSPPSVGDTKPGLLERFSLAGLFWLVSPVIAVLLMVVCAALALLQRLPRVGKRIGAINVTLAKGVGDSYLFAHDGLARAAMLQRIRRSLAWLAERGCRRVVVVAHSQGAALCHDLLRSAERPQRRLDLLVTVGSGVHRLNGFRDLYLDAKLRSLGWASIGALALLTPGLVLTASGVGRPGVPGAWAWTGVVLVLAGVLVPWVYRVPRVPEQAPPEPADPGPARRPARSRDARLGLVGLALTCAGALTLHAAGRFAQPQRWTLAIGGLLVLLGALSYVLAYRQVEARIVANRPRLALPAEAVARWIDYYATADPVPNGPLVTWADPEQPRPRTGPAVHPEPRCVHNLRSIYADHTAYFANADEFVSQLMLDLAGDELDLGLPEGRGSLLRERAERRWRTACRSNLRNLLLLAGVLGVAAISLELGGGRGWAGLGEDLGVTGRAGQGPFGEAAAAVHHWIGRLPLVGGVVGDLVGVPVFGGLLAAAAVMAAAAFALNWLWSVWDQRAIAAFFARRADAAATPPAAASARQASATPALPAAAFLGLSGLLLAAVAAVTARYAGTPWLLLAFAAAGLFTAALTTERWATSLRDRSGRPVGQAASPSEVGV
jgi:hypothetical protein